MIELRVVGPQTELAQVSEPILRALPEWFGIEESTRQYIADSQVLPGFVAYIERPVGFLSLTLHNSYSAEIHVIGVLPHMHGLGVGKALIGAAEAYLCSRGYRFLQVKTLSPAHPDPGYAKTRAFYRAVGFVPLEEFPMLWGEANPCLQMIKYLDYPNPLGMCTQT